jgi:hypothetical protein
MLQEPEAPLAQSSTSPQTCQLAHRVFHAAPGVAFRRAAEDGALMMVMPLGEREAAVPMRAIQREFHIAPDSDDGRMLGLIETALDHVPSLALGDLLPSEILTGAASWAPAPHHLWQAAARLRAGLLEWLAPGRYPAREPMQMMEALATDTELRASVQSAFEQAAHVLGLSSPEAAVASIDRLAQELSYIEALRETLLGRVQALVRRLILVRPARGTDAQRAEMMQRVGFLATTALRQLNDQFDVLDGQTGEVLAVLRNLDQQTLFIRQHRDSLAAANREWAALLDGWDALPSERGPAGQSETFWALLSRSYHFLAGRHMPTSEWRRAEADREAAMAAVREMSW